MLRRILLLCFVLPIFLLSCAKKTTNGEVEPLTPVDLLPVDNEISGWTRDGVPETAEDSQGLWDMINGAGEVHLDYGFVECAYQVYDGEVLGNATEIELYVFDQGSPENAELVYDDDRSGMGTPWTDDPAGTEARIDDSGLWAYVIEFWEERFFVELTIHEKSDEALEILKLFARNVSSKISEGSS